MANLITLGRFLAAVPAGGLSLFSTAIWQLGNAPLLFLIIALDGVDGYVARKRNETSVFGSIFDIAIDEWWRMSCGSCWPIWGWVADLGGDCLHYPQLNRGFDPLCGHFARRDGLWESFTHSWVASWSPAGSCGILWRSERRSPSAWAFFLQPLPILFPSAWQHNSVPALWITGFLVYASVVICLLRALPVILESSTNHGRSGGPSRLAVVTSPGHRRSRRHTAARRQRDPVHCAFGCNAPDRHSRASSKHGFHTSLCAAVSDADVMEEEQGLSGGSSLALRSSNGLGVSPPKASQHCFASLYSIGSLVTARLGMRSC
jgi:CDP-diacylglycerol--glycerol-3-phosphate 3-phosphatidyltransferase